MKQAFFTKNTDQIFDILWEGQQEEIDSHSQRVFGYTPNYLRVSTVIKKTKSLENKISLAKIRSFTEDQLMVELV